MTTELNSSTDAIRPTVDSNRSPPDVTTEPWVTRVAIAACVVIFLGLAMQNDYKSWATLTKFGYLPADAIWKGAYWGLITCVFVHFELWHIAFNVYWLWALGSRMERAIGSLRFLAFFLLSAFVSSSFELAIAGATGIGASGVGYAIFGFTWQARHRYPQFQQVLTPQIIRLFLGWLVGCVVVTYLHVWNIGNAAHVSGLIFGAAVATALVVRWRPRLTLAAAVAMVLVSVIPMFWRPWSADWLGMKAYDAQVAGQYETAIELYTRYIQKRPRTAWAYKNRGLAYTAIGKAENAVSDFERAQELNPSADDSK
jgi:rhomboid protease GluP